MKVRTVAAAASCLGLAAVSLVAPVTPAYADPDACVPVDEEECLPFEEITPGSRLFLGLGTDGSWRGFTAFADYADWAESEYGARMWVEDGRVQFAFEEEEAEEEPDDRLMRSGMPLQLAQFAIFYNRGDFRGSSFVLDPPNAINDLRQVGLPHQGTWNDKVSSVSTIGGRAGAAGAALCARVGCATPGWVLVVPNQTRLQLLGGLNNSASFVGVFG